MPINTNTHFQPKQNIYIDTFETKVFDFDNVTSKVYLAQQINQLLKPYGNNIIIEGFKLDNVKYELISESHIISFDITPGRCIIDNTYIEVVQPTNLVYDVTNLDDSGFIIVNLEYNYLHTPFKNNSIFKINYFNSAANNNTIGIDGINNNSYFFNEIPKIIINKITFNKELKKIKYFKYYNIPNIKINLLNKEYELYPKSPMLKDFIQLLQDRL